MWETVKIDIGTVKPNKTQTIKFVFNGDIEIIGSIGTSCGCTSAVFNKKENAIIVEYLPSKIPVHLKQKGIHTISTEKYVQVHYRSNGVEYTQLLSFYGFISEDV